MWNRQRPRANEPICCATKWTRHETRNTAHIHSDREWTREIQREKNPIWPPVQRNQRRERQIIYEKWRPRKISTQYRKIKNWNFFFSILLTVKIHSKSCKFWCKSRLNAFEINFIENFENFFNKIFGRNIFVMKEKKFFFRIWCVWLFPNALRERKKKTFFGRFGLDRNEQCTQHYRSNITY